MGTYQNVPKKQSLTVRLIQDRTIYTAVFLLRKTESNNKEYESGYFSYPEFKYNILGLVPYKVILGLPDERLIFASPILKIYEKLLSLSRVKDFLNILDTGIHSGNVREKIFFKEKVKEGLYRLLQGKQIEHWGIFWDRLEAKYKYCDINYIPQKQKGVGRKEQLSKHDEYWHFCGEIENHHQPERLLLRQSDDDLIVAYQSEKKTGRLYTDNTLFTILPLDKNVSLKYAMALFNSKLLNAIYQLLSQEEGKTLAQVKIGLVDELPFFLSDQKPFIEIVDRILKITSAENYDPKNTPQEQKLLEAKIDQMVYKLYGLTPEEIEIVEESSK